MTEVQVIKLPDLTEVHSTGNGQFNIVNPAQSTLGKYYTHDINDDWIIGLDYDCWIPSQYKSIHPQLFLGQHVFFGYASGHVVILNMSVPL